MLLSCVTVELAIRGLAIRGCTFEPTHFSPTQSLNRGQLTLTLHIPGFHLSFSKHMYANGIVYVSILRLYFFPLKKGRLSGEGYISPIL